MGILIQTSGETLHIDLLEVASTQFGLFLSSGTVRQRCTIQYQEAGSVLNHPRKPPGGASPRPRNARVFEITMSFQIAPTLTGCLTLAMLLT